MVINTTGISVLEIFIHLFTHVVIIIIQIDEIVDVPFPTLELQFQAHVGLVALVVKGELHDRALFVALHYRDVGNGELPYFLVGVQPSSIVEILENLAAGVL